MDDRPGTIDDELDRIRRFIRDHQTASTTRSTKWRWGTAYFHEGLPHVYDLNFMRLEENDGSITVPGLIEEAEATMKPLGHREIMVEDEAIGRSLAPGFKDAGWNVDRHVVMVHRRDPDPLPDTGAVVEVEEPDVWPSREEFLRTYEWCRDDEIAAQMHGAYRVWMRAGNGRDFAILEGGRPVSFAMLWTNGGVGQIEDVATLEPYRNRGLSRRVVVKAIQEARSTGCDVVFLIADEDDWPKQLYTKLGFESIAVGYYFVYVKS